eukprot:517094_1
MMIIHTFLSHQEAFLKFDNVDDSTIKDIKIIKIRNIMTKRFHQNKTKLNSKFVTEVDDFDEKEQNDNKSEDQHVFQFGERFYYWKSFKSGVLQKGEHYVEKTDFPNLKEEMLENNIYPLSLHVWKTELLKATKYKASYKGKQIKAQEWGGENFFYTTAVGCPISISHLLVVLLYTNQTELQYNFKKYGTRKLNKDDTISTIKHRNQQIGHWYKFLYELTWLYSEATNKKSVYFHGISMQLMMPSFNPYFQAPISTTSSITVAQQFAENGIILCLKAIAEHDGFMDVSWVSNYPQEEEKLFSFAYYLYINDIRFTDANIGFHTSNNWEITAIRLLDSIFNSNCFYSQKEIREKTQNLLIKFITSYNESLMDAIEKYIHKHKNKLKNIKQFIDEQQYDSDAIISDLQINDEDDNDEILNNENNSDSNVKMFFSSENDYQSFTYMVNENRVQISQYLSKLFLYKLNLLAKKKVIFIIKSEYMRLNNALRQELFTFNDNKLNISPFLSEFIKPQQIKCMNEFAWHIIDDEYDKLMKKKINSPLIGPQFSCVSEGGSVTFCLCLVRSSTSFLDTVGFSLVLLSLPSNTSQLLFRYSVAFPEVKYISPEYEATLKKHDQSAYTSFNNNLLKTMKSITFKVSLRTV